MRHARSTVGLQTKFAREKTLPNSPTDSLQFHESTTRANRAKSGHPEGQNGIKISNNIDNSTRFHTTRQIAFGLQLAAGKYRTRSRVLLLPRIRRDQRKSLAPSAVIHWTLLPSCRPARLHTREQLGLLGLTGSVRSECTLLLSGENQA
jgi:hypothetical protein